MKKLLLLLAAVIALAAQASAQPRTVTGTVLSAEDGEPLVVATVTTGKKIGVHAGRVAVRKTGSFNIQTAQGVVQGICHKHCRLIQRNDGYGYFFHGGKTTALPAFLPQPHRAASPEGRFASSPV